jgi:2-desacetyl-2-hydroxyethyl bacteriochlorophyllide A dehydrogenase
MANTMKAVIFHEHGGPERLTFEDVPVPKIGPQEVLVRVKACALNHLDIWVRQGIPAYRIAHPHISGCDVAGVIEAVGGDVADRKPGDRVFLSPGVSCWQCEFCLAGRDNHCISYRILGAHLDGGYAELIKAPALNAIPIPSSLGFEEAAAFPLVSVTAWHMLFTLGGLQPGETVLVMGAGSGVGSIAIQMARAAGATVITTVGAEEKIAKSKALGADAVILHTKEKIAERVKELTGGRGVQLVIEHIGSQVWEQCVLSLAKGGRLVTCGATTGPDVTLDLRYVFSRELSLRGAYVGTRADLIEAANLIAHGKLKPVVYQVLPLKEARAAQELLLSRKVFGKVVLTVE